MAGLLFVVQTSPETNSKKVGTRKKSDAGLWPKWTHKEHASLQYRECE